MPYKNTAVTVTFLAWDTTNNVGKTGDSANITLRGVGDGSEYTPSSPSITEMDNTNLKGVYKASLTAGENNYSFNLLGGVSSTSGVIIMPVMWTNEGDAKVVSYTTGQAPLQPTVAGRTLDVTANGNAGIDWANIDNPTATEVLSGTSVESVIDSEKGPTILPGV